MPAQTPTAAIPAPDEFNLRAAVRLVLPKEHGSWSLALEPIALGLLVAPSWAGIPLALAAGAGFFVRRPLKVLLQTKPDPRRSFAAICAGALLFLAAAGLLLAMEIGGAARLWLLIPAALAGGLFAWCDARGANRAGAAELAGATAFALLPAAFAALAGWSLTASLALTAVMLVRAVPTVILVRTFLRRRKGLAASNGLVWLTTIVASVILFCLARRALVPWALALFSILFVARAGWYMSGKSIWLSARRLGYTELILGVAMILVALAAWH